MSETTGVLRRKIAEAGDLQSVVRTMKAVAAANIGQYEKSVSALGDYFHTIEMGLSVCLQTAKAMSPPVHAPKISIKKSRKKVEAIVIVFGSDQGLVGSFNDLISDYALKTISTLKDRVQVWSVGDRVQNRLLSANQLVAKTFNLPNSIKDIAPLVGQILLETEKHRNSDDVIELHLFYNRPRAGASYSPVGQKLLPLDETWQRDIKQLSWPTKMKPEILGSSTLRALIREYLFVSIFRACAESLASENSSRLAAMQRAEKNIKELLATLTVNFHRQRQSGIDEELFDVVASFEALKSK